MPGLATGVAVVGGVAQGMMGAARSRAQAEVLEQQARQRQEVARAEERDFRRQLSRAQASNRARAGVSGVRQDIGSPLMVSSDLAGEGELQALRIRSGGDIDATRLRQGASLERQRGTSQLVGGLFRGGASFLNAPSFGGGGGFDVGSSRVVSQPRGRNLLFRN